MFLEAFGVTKLSEKIQKVKAHDDAPASSSMTPGERTMLIIEIIFVLILYVVMLGLWIWSIVFAFKKEDIVWGVLIILGGLPMALFYFLFLVAIKHDRSFKRLNLASAFKKMKI